jgi:hypothetical protein
MPSTRVVELKSNSDELRMLLLPSRFDPTGTYTNAERITARALSFRVLSHAELEACLEDRVLEIATIAKQAWETKKFVSVVAFHLIGFSGLLLDRPPDILSTSDPQQIKNWQGKINIGDRFSKCVTEFHRKVRIENHGIKEKNIMEMFLPIGVSVSKLDPLFLQTLSSFGESRGLVAHTSARAHIRKAVGPKDEYELLKRITKGLESIDEELDRLVVASTPP